MSLIVTDQHSRRDLERWGAVEREAIAVSRTRRHHELVDEARRVLDDFIPRGAGYVGVSWGKDSVVVAHLTAGRLPLVWICVRPRENPECALVRDRYFVDHPAPYYEVEILCTWSGSRWVAPRGRGGLTSSAGFDEAARRFGDRHVSGVRGDESSVRRIAMRRYGLASTRTCRPIGNWTSIDVFAYLLTHDLPIHPAYAYTMDGLLDPARLRVASLGGRRGDGMGRLEWERRYYRERLSEIERIGGA